MHSEPHRERSTPRPKSGFGRRFLSAFLAGADDALQQTRREAHERADDDQQCRLRPGYSRMTRGYEKTD